MLRYLCCLYLCMGITSTSVPATVSAHSFIMPHHPVIVMQTSAGTIELTLFPAVAPKAVENFIRLAQQGYYDNTTFHRVIRDFVIEGGDPTGTGKGGESVWKEPFVDEFDPEVTFNHAWRLGMKSKKPHSNGSQFFITTVPVPGLNGRQTLFGEVSHGHEIVKHIESSAQSDSHPGKPKHPVHIVKMYLKDAKETQGMSSN